MELFVLCPPPPHPKKKCKLVTDEEEIKAKYADAFDLLAHDEQLFVIPFAKSAVTGVHTPVRLETSIKRRRLTNSIT